MTPRKYTNTRREAAAADTRERVVEAAAVLLRDEQGIAAFSLDAVARAAGVTRLTVYNQFGSRRGLLEAVFDRIARAGGLMRLGEAMTQPSPAQALDRVAEIFCDFWDSDAAVRSLHQATLADAELAEALASRTERRRTLIAVIVSRVPGVQAASPAARDAVDMIFMLTAAATYASLRRNRTHERVVAMLKKAVGDSIAGL